MNSERLYIEDLAGHYNVQIKTTHNFLVTTDDPATTDISAATASEKFSFPQTIYLSDYTIDPLEKFSSWTAWYGVISSGTISSGSAKVGATTPISDGDTTISVPADTFKALYGVDDFTKSDIFNEGVTIIKLNTEFKTFNLPVLNALGEPEMNGSVQKTISITKNDDGNLDDIGDSFYLCYENKISEEETDRKEPRRYQL